MNRIILIIPYFGKFNNYFDLWLESAGNNECIDFLIVTDNPKPDYKKDNIIWVNSSFQKVFDNIQHLIPNLSIVLKRPYKLCEYRLLYGKLFEEYVCNYEFWGFCDMDLIFGDISHFLTNQTLDQYDKFYFRGHLTIFRNINYFSELYLISDKKMRLTYKEAWRTRHSCHFDELDAWNEIITRDGYRCYNNIDFADICIDSKRFKLALGEKSKDSKQIYKKDGKKLYRISVENGQIVQDEVMYIHLQKRTMDVLINKYDSYLIVPNEFIDIQNIDMNLIEEYSGFSKMWPEYMRKRVKEIFYNIYNGALKVRLQVLIRKVKSYVK